jgi:serine/threonine-protein kinase RsbT
MSCTVPIESESDIMTARQHGRELASLRGFSGPDQALIATAISEVARKMVEASSSMAGAARSSSARSSTTSHRRARAPWSR